MKASRPETPIPTGQPIPRLETDRLVLRKLRESDAESMYRYASNPEVTRHMAWPTHESLAVTREHLMATVARYEDPKAAFFDWGITLREGDDTLIGTLGFGVTSLHHGRAALGYIIDKPYWGRGLVPEAARAVLAFGFDVLGLNRISAYCYPENEASARVMEKLGMQFEGVLRGYDWRCNAGPGHYADAKLYAILRRDYDGQEFPPPEERHDGTGETSHPLT